MNKTNDELNASLLRLEDAGAPAFDLSDEERESARAILDAEDATAELHALRDATREHAAHLQRLAERNARPQRPRQGSTSAAELAARGVPTTLFIENF